MMPLTVKIIIVVLISIAVILYICTVVDMYKSKIFKKQK